MNITEHEKLIYYAGILYYEMAEDLKKQFQNALDGEISNLEDILKSIKLESKYIDAGKENANNDNYNAKLIKHGVTVITDGLRLVPTRGNKMLKKSPSKRRKKSRS